MPENDEGIRIITRDELREKIERGDRFTLVETLSAMYYRHTHLPGAINLEPTDDWESAVTTLLPDKNAEIVVYCAGPTCHTAADAARSLTTLGYTNVRDYAGGKEDWLAAGLPVEGSARARKPAAAH